MKRIVVDSGGTSLKYSVFNSNFKLLESNSLDAGNIINNTNRVLDNLKKILKKYPDIKSGVFAFAGYMALDESKKQLVFNILATIKNKLIIPDSLLPVYIKDLPIVAITLGTGTSIFKKDSHGIKEYLGYGYAIGDPGSGFEIGRRILYKILNSGVKKYINEIKHILNTDKKIVSYIWENKEQLPRKVSSISMLINSDNKDIKTIALKEFHSTFNELIKVLSNIIEENDLIVLNGGIFNNIKLSVDIIKKTFEKNKVVIIKNNPVEVGVKILKERKW